MNNVTIGILRESVFAKRVLRNIQGAWSASWGGRTIMAVALSCLLSGVGGNAFAQDPDPAAAPGEQIPSNAEITRPSGSTDALMDAYNKKIQAVMDQADPFSSQDPAEAFSAAEALKDNQEYSKALELYLKLAEETSDPAAFSGAAESAEGAGLNEQAIELANEALARHQEQYEALLVKAKAYKNLDQIPEARIMIEKAMETMAEDGSGVDAAVMDLYREIMQKTSGNPEVETP